MNKYSYSDDVFRKDIIKELNRIATALENINMKMTAKNSFDHEDALTYIKDEEPKTRTLKDCEGCDFLCWTVNPCLNEKFCKCSYYDKSIDKISVCMMR